MDKLENNLDREYQAGMIYKTASVQPQEVSDQDIKEINKFTLYPVTKEDVFSFKVAICDNETDRDYENFSIKALKELKRLYVGKTMIKDHRRSADNQVARIYNTGLMEDQDRTIKSGDPYTALVAKCYMIKTAGNADLIAEIKGGIKKEVSLGCRVNKSICSICGADNSKSYCPHYPGRQYEKEEGKTTCTFLLDGVSDAYELSFVAVPSQRGAGTMKNYGAKPEPEKRGPDNKKEDLKQLDFDVTCRIRGSESFLYVHKNSDGGKENE